MSSRVHLHHSNIRFTDGPLQEYQTNFIVAVIVLKQVLAIESRDSLNSQWTFDGRHMVENTIEPLYVHSRERLTHCIEKEIFFS